MSDLAITDPTPVLAHVFLCQIQDDKVASLHGEFLCFLFQHDFVANGQDLVVVSVGSVPESVDQARVQP